MKLTNNLSREDKKMINSICWRSLNAHCSRVGGQARQMAIGFLWQIMPALNRYYKDQPEKKKEALYRHVQFCNVSNAIYPFLAGLVASMEKENSEVDDFDTSSIVAIKAALMGPLAGIGDSLLFSVVRVIAAGIGISFALQGSILGPILFFLIYNGCTMALRFSLGYVGFISGSSFITNMYQNGTLKILTKCAGILGLIMVGAMTASTVKFTTAISIPIPGGEAVALQSSLDTLFLGLVPLLLTFGCKKTA
ncbi:PTS system mannose/fructose/sorbose family transporter subunit IID [[Clostridium] innocuum]|uniref:PTS system mannose/fructose/sorbose family transporter subunit IID n=1 Tax=Clostridium innocuum TaxID=1522 RepID=UPI001EDECC20|nr:PTS system mannose/fructose/sorbose family transporter subunit IID [[Clostridium] innocuum]MCG4660256.1 PTS system mannose/fructose/sorbose family transporter subunit IID [[Clostridium] innocuum]